MSRRRPHAGPAPPCASPSRLRSAASPSNNRRASSENLFEHLRCVLARGDTQRLGRESVQLGEIGAVIVRDGQVIEDVFAHGLKAARAPT